MRHGPGRRRLSWFRRGFCQATGGHWGRPYNIPAGRPYNIPAGRPYVPAGHPDALR